MRDPSLAIRLLRHLSAGGATPSADLRRALRVSAATLSRLTRRARADGRILTIGRGRATRYAARRVVTDVGSSVPVYEVDERGGTRRAAMLEAIEPGFFVDARRATIESRAHDDIPYWLHDLRPAGFLGRLIAKRHPELGLPASPQLWSGDHCLRYLTRFGWNMPGNLIVGEAALELFARSAGGPPDAVDARERARRYERLANDVISHGPVGSSAAGEQPKFLATLQPTGTAVLVKFSPPRAGNPVAVRQADLLIAEHLAHGIMRDHGGEAAPSRLVEAGDRLMLEVERFDRLPGGGRRGVLSLLALDAELVGSTAAEGWTDTAAALHGLGRIDAAAVARIRWLELFGHLIGNTDMHGGNLSFFVDGERVLGLTPTYDMLPMFYAPRDGHLVSDRLAPPPPRARDAGVWPGAHSAASALWSAVADHADVSKSFRAIARASLGALEEWARIARRLPS